MDQTGDEERSYLSTGLRSLDDQIEEGGLASGSLVAVRAPPETTGRRFAFNLCADRPVIYLAIGHNAARQTDLLVSATGRDSKRQITTETINITSVEDGTIADTIDSLVKNAQQETTIVVDSSTAFESVGKNATESLVVALNRAAEELDGMAIMYGVEAEEALPGRWLSLSSADAVFRLKRQEDDNEIKTALVVGRLPAGQQLQETAEGQTFEIPMKDNVSLDTSQTISP